MPENLIPSNARLLKLAEGTKVPLAGSRGHYDAVAGPAPSGNYGIALDDQFIVVDFDKGEPNDWRLDLPPTWTQRTRRGVHCLYRVRELSQNLHNTKFPYGDIKAKGYIVGPGSIVEGTKYEVTNAVEPVEAPDWLIDLLRQKEAIASPVEEREGIPEGEHDEYLHKLASWYRGRYGLNAETIARALREGPAAVLLGGRPEDPYTPRDFERIAQSVAKYEAEVDADLLNPQGWRSAADLNFAGPPREWWLHGFVPKGELVMVYGPGAAGKSTWGSWLASQATRRGGRFAFVGVEEPFERFAWRALLTGAVAELLHEVPTAGSLSFPSHIKALSEAVEALGVDLVYFDSIYAHFDDLGGLNAAERARKCLSPLAEMAQRLAITVVGVFHENKMGQYLGSTEMRNVGRVMLHATRENEGPMRLSVSKTNFRKPDYSLAFWGHDVALSDPTTGEVQLEVNEQGQAVPEIMTIVERVEKVGAPTTHVDVDTVEESNEAKVVTYYFEHPEATYRDIGEALGISKSRVGAILAPYKNLVLST